MSAGRKKGETIAAWGRMEDARNILHPAVESGKFTSVRKEQANVLRRRKYVRKCRMSSLFPRIRVPVASAFAHIITHTDSHTGQSSVLISLPAWEHFSERWSHCQWSGLHTDSERYRNAKLSVSKQLVVHVRTRAVRHDRWGSGSRLSRTGSQGTLGSDTRLVLEAVQVLSMSAVEVYVQ